MRTPILTLWDAQKPFNHRVTSSVNVSYDNRSSTDPHQELCQVRSIRLRLRNLVSTLSKIYYLITLTLFKGPESPSTFRRSPCKRPVIRQGNSKKTMLTISPTSFEACKNVILVKYEPMLRALYVLQEILHPYLLAICIFLILVPSLKFHELRTEEFILEFVL
jgi:hypothetical protein